MGSLNLKGKKDEPNTALLIRRLNHYNKMKGIVPGENNAPRGGLFAFGVGHSHSHASHTSSHPHHPHGPTGEKNFVQRYSHDLMDFQPWHWDSVKLGSFFLLLCRSNLFSNVLRALAIFDPENPLIDFVKFNRSFVQCRFEKSRDLLVKFVECMRKRFREDVDVDKKSAALVEKWKSASSESSASSSSSRYNATLFTNEAIWQLAEETIQWLLDDATYTRGHLLNILSVAKFSPTYTRYFRAYNLIKETDLHYPANGLSSR